EIHGRDDTRSGPGRKWRVRGDVKGVTPWRNAGLRKAAGLFARARLLHVRPPGQRFPVRVVLGLELPAAVVEGVSARFGRERHEEKAARGKVAGNHQSGDRCEVAAGLLLGPELGPRRQLLQAEGVVALRVTDITAGLPRLLLQEDRFDPRLEKLLI